jgi:flagellar basal-body rod protein FlgC
VDVSEIIELEREAIKLYEPNNPQADADGYVYGAPVDVDEEMVEMMEASRQYQNNLEVVTTLRALMMRTVNMGK